MGDPIDPRERQDPNATIQTIRRVLPTSRHACMLFDMVAGGLGDEVVLATADERTRLRMYRRDADGAGEVVPWPLLGLGTRGRLDVVVMLGGPPDATFEAPERSGKPPALRNLGPAEIVLFDGPQSITITYGDDGRWFESARSRSIHLFDGVVSALAGGGASVVDLLASYVESIDPGRHGPGRLVYPVPLPGGVAHAWNIGLYAIRDALFDRRIPEDATWAVADGYSGAALAWADSRDAAFDAWRAAVERVRPAHVAPQPEPEPESGSSEKEGVTMEMDPNALSFTMRIRMSKSDVEWPAASLANTPAVVVPLARGASTSDPRGSWVRLLSPRAVTYPALVRQDPGGFTVVGHGLLDVFDLDEIDVRIDALPPLTRPTVPPGREQPDYDCRTDTYRLVDDHTHEPVETRRVKSHWGWGFRARDLDGEELAWRVVRQRWYDAV